MIKRKPVMLVILALALAMCMFLFMALPACGKGDTSQTDEVNESLDESTDGADADKDQTEGKSDDKSDDKSDEKSDEKSDDNDGKTEYESVDATTVLRNAMGGMLTPEGETYAMDLTYDGMSAAGYIYMAVDIDNMSLDLSGIGDYGVLDWVGFALQVYAYAHIIVAVVDDDGNQELLIDLLPGDSLVDLLYGKIVNVYLGDGILAGGTTYNKEEIGNGADELLETVFRTVGQSLDAGITTYDEGDVDGVRMELDYDGEEGTSTAKVSVVADGFEMYVDCDVTKTVDGGKATYEYDFVNLTFSMPSINLDVILTPDTGDKTAHVTPAEDVNDLALDTLVTDLIIAVLDSSTLIANSYTFSGNISVGVDLSSISLGTISIDIDNFVLTLGDVFGDFYISFVGDLQDCKPLSGLFTVATASTIGLTWYDGYIVMARNLETATPEYRTMTTSEFVDKMLDSDPEVSSIAWLLGVGSGTWDLIVGLFGSSLFSADSLSYVQTMDGDETAVTQSLLDWLNLGQYVSSAKVALNGETLSDIGELNVEETFGFNDNYWAFELGDDFIYDITSGYIDSAAFAITHDAENGIGGIYLIASAFGLVDLIVNLDYDKGLTEEYDTSAGGLDIDLENNDALKVPNLFGVACGVEFAEGIFTADVSAGILTESQTFDVIYTDGSTVSQKNYSGSNVVWTSSDTSVATVDGNGVVTILSDGIAEISVQVGGFSASYYIIVGAEEVTDTGDSVYGDWIGDVSFNVSVTGTILGVEITTNYTVTGTATAGITADGFTLTLYLTNASASSGNTTLSEVLTVSAKKIYKKGDTYYVYGAGSLITMTIDTDGRLSVEFTMPITISEISFDGDAEIELTLTDASKTPVGVVFEEEVFETNTTSGPLSGAPAYGVVMGNGKIADNYTAETVSWSSSDTSVATIDATSGVITMVGAGATIITVTVDGFTASYVLVAGAEVIDQNDDILGDWTGDVSFSASVSLTIGTGTYTVTGTAEAKVTADGFTLTIHLTYAEALILTDKTLSDDIAVWTAEKIYKVGDTYYIVDGGLIVSITINSNGELCFKFTTPMVISEIDFDGDVELDLTLSNLARIVIGVEFEGDGIIETSTAPETLADAPTLVVTMGNGDTYTQENYAGTISWSSSDETVATVENGTVTLVGEGVTIITVTVDGFTASYALIVGATDITAEDNAIIDGWNADVSFSAKISSSRTYTVTGSVRAVIAADDGLTLTLYLDNASRTGSTSNSVTPDEIVIFENAKLYKIGDTYYAVTADNFAVITYDETIGLCIKFTATMNLAISSYTFEGDVEFDLTFSRMSQIPVGVEFEGTDIITTVETSNTLSGAPEFTVNMMDGSQIAQNGYSGEVTWSSSDTAVASIDTSTGEITLAGAGVTTITVTVDGISASYILVVGYEEIKSDDPVIDDWKTKETFDARVLTGILSYTTYTVTAQIKINVSAENGFTLTVTLTQAEESGKVTTLSETYTVWENGKLYKAGDIYYIIDAATGTVTRITIDEDNKLNVSFTLAVDITEIDYSESQTFALAAKRTSDVEVDSVSFESEVCVTSETTGTLTDAPKFTLGFDDGTAMEQSEYTGDVTWESSDTSVATVAYDGTITLVKAGITYITATVNGCSSSYILIVGGEIVVSGDTILGSWSGDVSFSVSVSSSRYTVTGTAEAEITAEGFSLTLHLTYASAILSWNDKTLSDDITVLAAEKIYKVGDTYYVVYGGSAVSITINSNDKLCINFTASMDISEISFDGDVELELTLSNLARTLVGVELEGDGIIETNVSYGTFDGAPTFVVTMMNGDTYTQENYSGTVAWSSSDESVASVGEDGTITLVAPGVTFITVAVGEYSATYALVVGYVEMSETDSVYGNWSEDVTFTVTYKLGSSTTDYEVAATMSAEVDEEGKFSLTIYLEKEKSASYAIGSYEYVWTEAQLYKTADGTYYIIDTESGEITSLAITDGKLCIEFTYYILCNVTSSRKGSADVTFNLGMEKSTGSEDA